MRPSHLPKGTIVVATTTNALNNEYEDENSPEFSNPETIPHPLDVLSARSSGSFKHYGNRRYRRIVSNHKAAYDQTSNRQERKLIALSIVKECGGRFLKVLPKAKTEDGNLEHPDDVDRFEVMDQDEAIKKTILALKDRGRGRNSSNQGDTNTTKRNDNDTSHNSPNVQKQQDDKVEHFAIDCGDVLSNTGDVETDKPQAEVQDGTITAASVDVDEAQEETAGGCLKKRKKRKTKKSAKVTFAENGLINISHGTPTTPPNDLQIPASPSVDKIISKNGISPQSNGNNQNHGRGRGAASKTLKMLSKLRFDENRKKGASPKMAHKRKTVDNGEMKLETKQETPKKESPRIGKERRMAAKMAKTKPQIRQLKRKRGDGGECKLDSHPLNLVVDDLFRIVAAARKTKKGNKMTNDSSSGRPSHGEGDDASRENLHKDDGWDRPEVQNQVRLQLMRRYVAAARTGMEPNEFTERILKYFFASDDGRAEVMTINFPKQKQSSFDPPPKNHAQSLIRPDDTIGDDTTVETRTPGLSSTTLAFSKSPDIQKTSSSLPRNDVVVSTLMPIHSKESLQTEGTEDIRSKHTPQDTFTSST